MTDAIANPLPAEQIHAFWSRVEQSLRSRRRASADRAVRAILRYRNEIERVGPILYHRDSADIADDIVNGGYAAAGRKVG